MKLQVKVAPKASCNAVTGWMGEILKVSVTSAPEKGKANQAVIGVLAEALALPRTSIQILRGENGKGKLVGIEGLDEGEILRRLGKTSP